MKDVQRYIGQHVGVLGALGTILTSRGFLALALYRFRFWLLHKCVPHCESLSFFFKGLSIICMHISRVLAKSEIEPETKIKRNYSAEKNC